MLSGLEAHLDAADTGSVAFVVVGAGHMLGQTGLVTQLRARGFDVSRVSATR